MGKFEHYVLQSMHIVWKIADVRNNGVWVTNEIQVMMRKNAEQLWKTEAQINLSFKWQRMHN